MNTFGANKYRDYNRYDSEIETPNAEAAVPSQDQKIRNIFVLKGPKPSNPIDTYQSHDETGDMTRTGG